MESVPADLIANEHDYTTVEVPVDAIKGEIIELEEDDDIQEVPLELPEFIDRVPVFLKDNKPKLRVRKELLVPRKPLSRSLLIPSQKTSPPPPRPIMPKFQFSLPVPPNSNVEPPKNCKGVFVVQDIKVCTMYVPKSEDGSSPKMTLPMGAFTSSPIIKSTLDPPILSRIIPTKKPNESTCAKTATVTTIPAKTATVKTIPSGNSNRRKQPTVEPHTITAPITLSNKKNSTDSTNTLIEDVQKLLIDKLPICWFSAVEKDGINVMLLSLGKEKAIQRRLFVSTTGSVEISVHCKPLLESFVSEILKKAGVSVGLNVSTVKIFSDWVLKLVHILRDFHVCVGLEWINPPNEVIQQDNVMLDSNPYQESRFSETLRSKSCLRLVDLGKRKCIECCKAYSSAAKNVKCGNKSPQIQPQRKKRSAPSGPEGDDSENSTRDSDGSSEYSPEPPKSSKLKKRKSVLKNKKSSAND